MPNPDPFALENLLPVTDPSTPATARELLIEACIIVNNDLDLTEPRVKCWLERASKFLGE